MPRTILKTGYSCNNRCRFCHSSALTSIPDLTEPQLLARLEEARGAGFTGVVLSGGEPTIRRDLLSVGRRARELGLGFGLITNGRMLAYEKLARSLVEETGLDYAYISLHGPDSATHDHLTGIPGSFKQTLAGIRNLSALAPFRPLVNVVVVNHNIRLLPRIAALLAGLNVVIKFSYVEPKGEMLEHGEEIPSPRDAARAITSVLERCLAAGLPRDRLAWDGLPHCYMPRWRDRFDDLFTNGIVALREADEDFFPMVDYRNMIRPPLCLGCLIGDECRGAYTRLWDFFPGLRLLPEKGGLSNSFNYEPSEVLPPLEIPGDGCPVRAALEQGDLAPNARRLYVEKQGRLHPMVTDTGDFREEDILRVSHELGQVYLDRSREVLLQDFAAQLGCTVQKEWCRDCPWTSGCSGAFSPSRDDPFTRAEEEVLRILEQVSGRVVDVGCGGGRYGDLVVNALESGRFSEYLAVDPAPGPDIYKLQERFPQARLVDSFIEELYLTSGSFDWVLVLRSHNHFGDLWESYFRMVRCLKPGGHLLVVDNTAFALVREQAETMAAVRELEGVEPEHIRNHTGPEAESFLSRFPLTLEASLDVGPGSANQWLRLYRFHGWAEQGPGEDDHG